MTQLVRTAEFEGADAEERLRALGLDVAGLQQVVMQGEQARAEATRHDPINAAGWDAYRYRVRAFRDIYVPNGWFVDHRGGLEKTWSPDGQHVVITRAGNGGVGIPSTCPQPEGRKGNQVRRIVDGGTLLLDPTWVNVVPKKREDFATWLVLVCRRGNHVFSEMSSPTGFNDDETVLGWYARILLPTIDLTEPDPFVGGSYEAPEPIDVPVVRKR